MVAFRSMCALFLCRRLQFRQFHRSFRLSPAICMGMLLPLMLLPGCVHRRMTVQSNPPGAMAIVDGREIGYTPASIDFTYYGTREIKLVKPGYESLNVLQEIPSPWYQKLPFDFFSDNLLPFKVTNRHQFMYNLRPSVQVREEDLLDRANALRTESQVGF